MISNNLDFSYDSYRCLLKFLQKNEYKSFWIGDSSEAKTKSLYLRHDVDVDYLGILPLATIEHELGMKSTWYFLPDCPIYNLCSHELRNMILQLDNQGHQIGLHIDANRYHNMEKMIESINNQYVFFSSFLPVSKTLSFHRPAPWLLNNVDIPDWVNAYQAEYYSDVIYVSDSNRREFWKEDRLSTAITSNKSLTLLTHPLWWKTTCYSIDDIYKYISEFGTRIATSVLQDTCLIYNN